jgi:Tfp pilus assembly protein PilF
VPSAEALQKAGDAAKKANAIDDHIAAVHASLAIVHWWKDRKLDLAETEFKRAIELDGNDSRSFAVYGWFLIAVGRTEDGLQKAEWAGKIDPLSVKTAGLLGQSYYFARDYKRAIEQLKRTTEMDPSFWLGHSFLGRAYLRRDQFEPALEELKKAVELEPNFAENHAVLAFAYGRAGKLDDARRTFDAIKSRPDVFMPKYNEAKYYIAAGNKDRAFQLLDGALADDSFNIALLKVDPELDSLREDPRFEQLVVKAGL